MIRLLRKRLILLGLVVVATTFVVSAGLSLASGSCKTGYHFVQTPSSAPYAVTACTKFTWKTVLYSFVPDTTTIQQPLLTAATPNKHKGTVELDVITVKADSLEDAVNTYYDNHIPDTLIYTSDTKYFAGGDIAIDESSAAATSLQAIRDNLNLNLNLNINSNTNTGTTITSSPLTTTVYAFDNDNNRLYILDVYAKKQTSVFSRQAIKIAQSVTAAINTK